MGKTDQKEELFDSTMSLGDHLEELRARLILAILGLAVGTVVCLFFGNWIISFIQRPYNNLRPDSPLIVLAPADAFIGYMKICVIAGLILSSPWVFYQFWMFVAAGLYSNEKRYVRRAVPFSVVLFVAGALFFLFVVAPLSLAFFLKFGNYINVKSEWTFQKYVSFMTMLMLVFGIGFHSHFYPEQNRSGFDSFIASVEEVCASGDLCHRSHGYSARCYFAGDTGRAFVFAV
jgi:sec-independent protein translocase protein TatC